MTGGADPLGRTVEERLQAIGHNMASTLATAHDNQNRVYDLENRLGVNTDSLGRTIQDQIKAVVINHVSTMGKVYDLEKRVYDLEQRLQG